MGTNFASSGKGKKQKTKKHKRIRIIEKLEQGVVPWRMPWISGGAVNWKTQKPYRGINIFLWMQESMRHLNKLRKLEVR